MSFFPKFAVNWRMFQRIWLLRTYVRTGDARDHSSVIELHI